MLKLKMIIAVLIIALMPGCSLVDSVSQTLDYSEQATSYINETADFAQQLPGMAEQAVNDTGAKDALIRELESMKETVLQFDQLEAPKLAQDIHNQILEYNSTLQTEIDGLLQNLNDQVPVLQALENSQIIQTIDQIGKLLGGIQNLG